MNYVLAHQQFAENSWQVWSNNGDALAYHCPRGREASRREQGNLDAQSGLYQFHVRRVLRRSNVDECEEIYEEGDYEGILSTFQEMGKDQPGKSYWPTCHHYFTIMLEQFINRVKGWCVYLACG